MEPRSSISKQAGPGNSCYYVYRRPGAALVSNTIFLCEDLFIPLPWKCSQKAGSAPDNIENEIEKNACRLHGRDKSMDEYAYLSINDDLETAVEDVLAIIRLRKIKAPAIQTRFSGF
jgi:hypothetical protein